jgi:hypothetical protein
MPDLIAVFQKFQRSYRDNPDDEKETTVFIRHLKEEGILGEFTEVDWFKLAQKLELTDDEFGVMFEGTASWIIDEPVMPSRQEPADWPDEVPRGGVSLKPNPAVKYGKGTEIEDCVCEETCNCNPCPCDECPTCHFCLCCDVCEEPEEDEDDEYDGGEEE